MTAVNRAPITNQIVIICLFAVFSVILAPKTHAQDELPDLVRRIKPAAVAIETFDALPFVSMISVFKSPELRKHSGVGLNDP